MKFTFILSTFFLFLTGYCANAQVAVYMRNDFDDEATLDLDSAAFKRVIYDIDSGKNGYAIQDYFLDGKLKGRGFASTVNPFIYTGQRVEYFKNGKKRMMGHFINGEMVGRVYRYHPNGALYVEQEYPPSKFDTVKGRLIESGPVILALTDSSGADIIKDGVGHYIEYDQYDPKIITAEGDILNGKWEGQVKGFLPREDLKYTEAYKDGVLISGISTDSLGNEYTYSENKTSPIFKGGTEAFYKFIQQNLRYPEAAAARGIQGKALVKFRVYTNGKAGNFEIANYINVDLGLEAIRVVKAAGNWSPATLKGKPVNAILTVPISYSLN